MTATQENRHLVVGVDASATNMQFGVVDPAGRILGRTAGKTEAEFGVEHVVGNIVRGVRGAADAASCPLCDLAAVGIAAAGAIDIPRGIILNAPNLNWIDVPLRALLQEQLCLPVVLDNDVNGAVWGEYRLGAARERGDVLGVWVGTGIGGGLVLDGKLHHGEFFTAGEIGNTILFPRGEPGRRTVEDIASRTGIRRTIASRLPQHPDSMLGRLSGGDVNRLGTAELVDAYHACDPLAREVINEAAELLGLAIANWVTVLAMKTVVLGGGMIESLGDPYFQRIRTGFDAAVFPDRCRECDLRRTELQADAGLLGAALLARDAVAQKR